MATDVPDSVVSLFYSYSSDLKKVPQGTVRYRTSKRSHTHTHIYTIM